MIELTQEFGFDAAHFLGAGAVENQRLHGHSFRCEVHVRGDVGKESGWVLDFSDIKAAFAPLDQLLDHNYLNEVEGLSNPTSENLARWIWERLIRELPGLSAVVVRETCTTGCVYRGEV